MATDEDQEQQDQQDDEQAQSSQGKSKQGQGKSQSKQSQTKQSGGKQSGGKQSRSKQSQTKQSQTKQSGDKQSQSKQGQRRQQKAEGDEEQRPQEDGGDSGGGGQDSDVTAVEAAGRAREQLSELLGMPADTVSGVSLADGSWRVRIEVVEHRRLPPSTDVLATYEVELDARGRLLGYERTDRYLRGQPVGST